MPSNFLPSLPLGQSSIASGLTEQWGALKNLDPSGLLAGLLLWLKDTGLSQDSRPIRLRIQRGQQPLSGMLVAHSFCIDEEVCASTSVHMRILCMSTRADLSPKSLLGMPVAAQIVTDRGNLRAVHGIITKAVPGQSDGGAQVWLIEAHDALAIKRRGSNTRVFLRHSVVDIANRLLKEWRLADPVLAEAFDFDLSKLRPEIYPAREMTIQWNESDADFLMRMLRKHGISWAVRPGTLNAHDDGHGTPCHTLVLFDDSHALPQNDAGSLRYHQDGATQQRDGITLWSPVVSLVPARVERRTFDYKSQRMAEHQVPTMSDLGHSGNQLARGLTDSIIEPPHWGDSQDDFQRLSTLRMQRHEMEADYIQGASGARDAACMTWVEVQDLPGAAARSAEDRQYLFLQVTHYGQNNLPKDLNERVTGLFAASGWTPERPVIGTGDASRRYANTFKAISRKTALVPAFDPTADWPAMHPMTVVVVCPPGEEVYCDAIGRVKVQFRGLRVTDNEHAQGAGSLGTDVDSAWVRFAHPAANRRGGRLQLPRAGDEATMFFMHGDPDKPFLTHGMFSPQNQPPAFHQIGGLPGNRYECGNYVQEIHGNGYVQTRSDATPGQISYQAACSYKAGALSIGYIRTPRSEGRAEPRGEGFELSTRGHGTLRADSGLLVSTQPDPNGQGAILARDAMLGLMQPLQEAVDGLGNIAEHHQGEAKDMTPLAQLHENLRSWEFGTVTDPGKPGGSVPLVAVSATAGAAVISQDNLMLGAQTNIDAVSIGNIQFTAGRKLIQHARTGHSTFVEAGILEAIIASGLLKIENHNGDIHLSAKGNLVLSATGKVIIQAPAVDVVSQGAQTAWGDGSIVEQAAREYAIKSASFAHTQGGGGAPGAAQLPTSASSFDQHIVLTDMHTDEPLANQRCRIHVEDGQTIECTSDTYGKVPAFRTSIPYARYTIELLK